MVSWKRGMRRAAVLRVILGLVVMSGWLGACAASSGQQGDDDGSTGSGGSTSSGFGGGFDGVGGGGGIIGDPKTCEEAAVAKSYVGCDFWPTVTPNAVWSIFDYAVVVANTGDNVVDIAVQRNGSQIASAQIQPNSLQTVYLPWVPALKGPDADAFGGAQPVTNSITSPGGAYHLTASFPVTVYQFSALQYAPVGGAPGKNWGLCPADGILIECFSYSNDASLLLP
ncbi:MAG: hypothetical protein KC731_31885, partial [Myxococcales bacterium]|nr:hypothetical protein [Myxococcales bacterium]